MTYPPPNPYDPNQSPGYGQPSQQPFGQPSPPGYGVPSQPGGGFSAPPQQPGFSPQPGFSDQQPGLPPQPGFPPPPGGQYGAPLPPPMPPASGNGGLVAKILSVVGVVAVGLVIVVVRALNNDSDSDSNNTANETATETVTEAATEAVETALPEEEGSTVRPADVGDCMSDAAEGTSTDLVVPCDDPTAYWTVTEVSDDSGATHSALGGLDDPAAAEAVCGHEHMVWTPGEIWKSYQYVYTESYEGLGGPVDYLYCVEAIDKEDTEGGRPVTPDVGDCTDGTTVRTFDCSNAAALYVVDAIETYDPPIDELSFDYTTALGGCPGSDYYATPVSGGDEILPVVYLAYCSSDN